MSKTAKAIVVIIITVIVFWAVSTFIKSVGTKSIGPGTGPVVAPGEKIKVGLIAPLSGPVADYGEQVRRGTMDGAVAGVEIVVEDEKCEPKDAVSAFQKLTSFDRIKFILGPACGSPQEAIVPLLKGKDIIAVVSAAASSDLFAQSGGNFWNIQYSLQNESKFIAEKMLAMGHKHVALVSYGNAFSKTHADSFKKWYKGNIAYETTVIEPLTDVSTEATKIAQADVDSIYSPDISFFFGDGVNKVRQFGVTAPIFSTYVAELPAVRDLVPNVFYSYPGNLGGGEGAVYELSKQASALLTGAVVECRGDYGCVKDKLTSSGLFDENGIYKRDLILKQISGGKTVEVK